MLTITRIRLASVLLSIAAFALLAAGCGSSSDASSSSTKQGSEGGKKTPSMPSDVTSRSGMYDEAPTERLNPDTKYVVRLTTSKGDIDIAIDQKAGPIAAANFVWLVKQGFYDGTTFHRVIDGFMIQGGDPAGDGSGDPGYTIKDDPVHQKYTRGTVAMANRGPDTGGSQFFIVQGDDAAHLGPDYSIFGMVDKAGMKVVDAIASAKTTPGPDGAMSSPVDPVVIEHATLVQGSKDDG